MRNWCLCIPDILYERVGYKFRSSKLFVFLFVAAHFQRLTPWSRERRARRTPRCRAPRTSSARRSRSPKTSRSFWEQPRKPNTRGRFGLNRSLRMDTWKLQNVGCISKHSSNKDLLTAWQRPPSTVCIFQPWLHFFRLVVVLRVAVILKAEVCLSVTKSHRLTSLNSLWGGGENGGGGGEGSSVSKCSWQEANITWPASPAWQTKTHRDFFKLMRLMRCFICHGYVQPSIF